MKNPELDIVALHKAFDVYVCEVQTPAMGPPYMQKYLLQVSTESWKVSIPLI